MFFVTHPILCPSIVCNVCLPTTQGLASLAEENSDVVPFVSTDRCGRPQLNRPPHSPWESREEPARVSFSPECWESALVRSRTYTGTIEYGYLVRWYAYIGCLARGALLTRTSPSLCRTGQYQIWCSLVSRLRRFFENSMRERCINLLDYWCFFAVVASNGTHHVARLNACDAPIMACAARLSWDSCEVRFRKEGRKTTLCLPL